MSWPTGLNRGREAWRECAGEAECVRRLYGRLLMIWYGVLLCLVGTVVVSLVACRALLGRRELLEKCKACPVLQRGLAQMLCRRGL